MAIIRNKHPEYPERILIRKISGDIGVNDLIKSWEEFIQNNFLNERIKGVINDLSDCKLIMDFTDFDNLMNFLKKHECFKNIRLAVVSDNPKIIIFPTFGELKEKEINIKPFTTFEAATKWIMQ